MANNSPETRTERRARERREAKERERNEKCLSPEQANAPTELNNRVLGNNSISRRKLLKYGLYTLGLSGLAYLGYKLTSSKQINDLGSQNNTISYVVNEKQRLEFDTYMSKLKKYCRIENLIQGDNKKGILYIIGQEHPGSMSKETKREFFLKNPSIYSEIISVLGVIGEREKLTEGRGEFFVMNEGMPSGQFKFSDEQERKLNPYRDLSIQEISNILEKNPDFTPVDVVEYMYPLHLMVGGIGDLEKKLLEEGQTIRTERKEIMLRHLELSSQPQSTEREIEKAKLYSRAKTIMSRDVDIDTERSKLYLEETLKTINGLNARNGAIVIGQLHLPEMVQMYKQLPVSLTRNRTLITMNPLSLKVLTELENSSRGYYGELKYRKTLECLPLP